MRAIFYIFLIGVFFASCELCSGDPDPIPIMECIDVEEISYQDTGVFIINKGIQDYGAGYAIKLNEVWESSVGGQEFDSFNKYYLRTFWEELGGVLVLGESMSFTIPNDFENDCFSLYESNEIGLEPGLVKVTYSLYHDDSLLKEFYLDTTANNMIEVIEHNRVSGVIKAKFQCTFKTDEPFYPSHPEMVRFFNGEFEYYGW